MLNETNKINNKYYPKKYLKFIKAKRCKVVIKKLKRCLKISKQIIQQNKNKKFE